MTVAWDKAETARLLAEAKAWPVNTGWSFIRTMHGLAAQLEAAGFEIDVATAERDLCALNHRLDAQEVTAERDSLRQQLEAARRDSDTYAHDHRDSVEDEAKLAADLAAAQQRIAELEGELASARDDRGRLLGERVMFAAALRAIAPVWQTAAAEQTATAIPDENGQPMPCECASCCAVRTSLARLTPELLAVIEAVTR